jgi:ribosome maturation factor RimP
MRVEKWALPTFFTPPAKIPGMSEPTEQDIQQELSDLDSGIDLVALEKPRNDSLRLFIDHPDGVDLALCERVTKHLKHLLVDYSMEVSSPGPKYRDRRPATSTEDKESAQ